jgi:3-hydroxyacyl-[acyl-carrier-protein] dehydratase
VIEHYVDPDAREKLRKGGDDLGLIKDLGIDSLTLLEIVFLAEEGLQVSIENDELRPFCTVGDVKKVILAKVCGAS